MKFKSEWKPLVVMVGVFLVFFLLPVKSERLRGAVMQSLALARSYAREHVLTCLVPAFFIAGAIAVFVSQAAVIRYLGARANKVLAYGVASVSGSVLAVCSCTVLPLFAGIYKRGAGIGPATTFLYSGPAINVLAIVLTATRLGWQLGVARAVGAVVFSIVIGLVMHLVFRKEEQANAADAAAMPEPEVKRPLWKNAAFFATMVAILVFAAWKSPPPEPVDWYVACPCAAKLEYVGVFALLLIAMLVAWLGVKWWHAALAFLPAAVLGVLLSDMPEVPFTAGVVGLAAVLYITKGESEEWLDSSWGLAKQITPLLFAGVLVAGFLLPAPGGREGVIPSEWVASLVGGNSLRANFFASVAGALMYFATLTEVPIVEGFLKAKMGKGP
ncbi:MAG: permease, partial [Planctomycetota bacterium]